MLTELSDRNIGEALLDLERYVTTQVNLIMVCRVNDVYRYVKSRLRDFVRINPPIFL